MRREKCMLLGGTLLLFWAGIYYVSYVSMPPDEGKSEKLEARSRYEACHISAMILIKWFVFRQIEQGFEQIQRQLKSQIKSNSLLLDKLKMLKSDIGSNNEAVVDITKFIELLENPDDSDVDQIVRIVERHKPKPKERSEELNVNTFEDDEQDVKNSYKEDTNYDDDDIDDVQDKAAGSSSKPVMPVLLFSCNRVSVNRALDLLISYRPSKEQFPIIVTQDCGHQETRYVSMSGTHEDDAFASFRNVIESYGDEIIYIQQPDLSEPKLPEKEKKFKGYFKIARHYGWALNQTLMSMGYDQV